uniref:ATP-binding cassette domain-containing protein n=1 Tax=Blautia marasmi TaxID=1917868 RepID=UPI00266CB524
KGQTVAFVGESGSGKSKLVKLICGLLKKQQGSIFIDGTDIDAIELDSYSEHLAYLSQDTAVFDGTIRENIVFEEVISDDEIYKYLKEVNLYEKVKSLKNKLDTRIGERGIQLSGGERQRLALAKVMANKKDILILDEATSALDTVNEQMIINHIMRSMEKSTIIMVAHRIQSIKNADMIIVFKDFKINGIGTFDELIRTNQYFQELWDRGERL